MGRWKSRTEQRGMEKVRTCEGKVRDERQTKIGNSVHQKVVRGMQRKGRRERVEEVGCW